MKMAVTHLAFGRAEGWERIGHELNVSTCRHRLTELVLVERMASGANVEESVILDRLFSFHLSVIDGDEETKVEVNAERHEWSDVSGVPDGVAIQRL